MKKPLISALIACAILAFAAGASAEEAAPFDSPAVLYPSSVGVFGSTMIGGGLSYQRWNGPFGYALTLGGSISPGSSTYYDPYGTGTDTTGVYSWSYNAELDIMYKLFSSSYWNWLAGDLFAYATLGHMGKADAVYTANADTTKPGSYAPGAYSPAFSLGVGIGYEITLFRHFSVPLQFGYTGTWPLELAFNVSGGLRYRY